MKKQLTTKDIYKVYNQLINDAYKAFEKKQFEKALNSISTAAYWAYSFNAFYFDKNAEILIKEIGNILYETKDILKTNDNRYVFIDSFCYDNRGLTQQYIRALISLNKEILYIVTSESTQLGHEILKELKSYSNSKIILFSSITGSYNEKISSCINEIINFSPKRILLHISPWDYKALLICHAIKGSTKFNINLTDHAFWLGVTFIDYNIEFRSYGYTVSLEKRELKKEQLLTLPYYPIKSKYTSFQGFPLIDNNHIKILSGGSLYKILGKNDIYFKLLDHILDLSEKVTILIAGFENSKIFENKISKLKHKARIIQIGNRKDIDAVFENCDIYLGTYPICGGLMSQYAAMHAKPILAYFEKNDTMNDIGGIINNYGNPFKGHSDIHDFLIHAKNLINNQDYRIEEGKQLQKALMTEDKFNHEFCILIDTLSNHWSWDKVYIDYEQFASHYLNIENTQNPSAIRYLVLHLNWNIFHSYKWLFSLTIPTFYSIYENKIKNKIKKWIYQ